MFEDSLLESTHRFRTKRGTTTALSAALQFTILGALVLLPLIYTEALPRMQLLTTLPPPPAPAARTTSTAGHHVTRVVVSELRDGQLLLPRAVPAHARLVEDAPPTGASGCADCMGVPGSTGSDLSNSRLMSVLLFHPTSPPPPPQVERLVVSRGVSEGHLVRRVEPEYPAIARQARIEGDVLLRAVIGRDGSIQNLSVVSGHPFLARAALDAVRQWQYQPFLLSGRAVEVDSEILVRFRMSR
jgi:periplasmic protein TonB